ncbi:MAG: hypothetical protein HUK08_01465 [Bacteroidaceae bacterium]|nr:hypothetical protein [Bacteroidaceae bacterium]
MAKRIYLKTLLLIVAGISLLSLSGHAQAPSVTKDITIGDTLIYTEDISLGGTPELKATLKVMFSDADNNVVVRLVKKPDAEGSILGFTAPVRYKHIAKGALWIRLFNPKRMPYPVSYDLDTYYRMKKDFRELIPTPRDGYSFTPWVTGYGMFPVQQPIQNMENDSIEQRFTIKDIHEDVFMQLGDILGMQRNKRRILGMQVQNLLMVRSDQKYRITVQRDTCFLYKDTVNIMRNELAELRKDSTLLATMQQNFNKQPSKGGADMFNEVQGRVLAKRKLQPLWHICSDLLAAYGEYNAILDAMNKMECVYVAPPPTPAEIEAKENAGKPPLDIPSMLKLIRSMDGTKVRLVTTTDPYEKADLMKVARMAIADGNDMLKKSRVLTSSEKKTRDLFHKAVNSLNKYMEK